MQLYDVTAAAVKGVDPRLAVGGPSSAAAGWVDELLEHVQHVRVAGRLRDRPTPTATRRSTSGPPWSASAAPRRIVWTEWGVTPTHFNPVNDSVSSATFLLHGMRSSAGRLDALSYWVASDHFEELGRPPRMLHGGFGLITVGGIAKSRYHALHLLSRLGETQLPVVADGRRGRRPGAGLGLPPRRRLADRPGLEPHPRPGQGGRRRRRSPAPSGSGSTASTTTPPRRSPGSTPTTATSPPWPRGSASATGRPTSSGSSCARPTASPTSRSSSTRGRRGLVLDLPQPVGGAGPGRLPRPVTDGRRRGRPGHADLAGGPRRGRATSSTTATTPDDPGAARPRRRRPAGRAVPAVRRHPARGRRLVRRRRPCGRSTTVRASPGRRSTASRCRTTRPAPAPDGRRPGRRRRPPRPAAPAVAGLHRQRAPQPPAVRRPEPAAGRSARSRCAALRRVHAELGVRRVRAHGTLGDDLDVYREDADGLPRARLRRPRQGARHRARAPACGRCWSSGSPRGRWATRPGTRSPPPGSPNPPQRPGPVGRPGRGVRDPPAGAVRRRRARPGLGARGLERAQPRLLLDRRPGRLPAPVRRHGRRGPAGAPDDPRGRTGHRGGRLARRVPRARGGVGLRPRPAHPPRLRHPAARRAGRARAATAARTSGVWWTEWGPTPTHFHPVNDHPWVATFTARGMLAAAAPGRRGRVLGRQRPLRGARPPAARSCTAASACSASATWPSRGSGRSAALELLGDEEVGVRLDGDGAESLVQAWASVDADPERVAVAVWNGTLQQHDWALRPRRPAAHGAPRAARPARRPVRRTPPAGRAPTTPTWPATPPSSG